ncbi:MAG: D-glycero-beta-D-manno-heptose 1-phosphate adenylyltransferase [Candidatus Marinimicrobia bacterium]|nr:D-glycero-beta-D-manno-heptose 1-phosphate adenylyltransferase [Candidatus Neomarinimicrobiota bacterium]
MPIVNRSEAKKTIDNWRTDHKTIVFTNGCFDIIHRGHIEYLRKAKLLGDILIVGLNSDASVRRIKGEPRPYQNELDRAVILDAMEMVELVIIFNEDTPLNLICELKPDVLVKGGDYDRHAIVGAKEVENWGGRVIIIPFLKGFGTTKLVEKILEK